MFKVVELDCQSCGACCISSKDPDADKLCHLLDTDKVRLGSDEHIIGDHIATKVDRDLGCACVYLVGVPGKVSCQVFERRPLACVLIDVGDKQCAKARKRIGLDG